MKSFYSIQKIFLTAWAVAVFSMAGKAQCPDGQLVTGLHYDSTVNLPPGVQNAEIKFPKFNPANGMVTYMRLCLTISGVVDSLSFENTGNVPYNYSAHYSRFDELTGDGLSTPLNNYAFRPYSFNLAATDGANGAGPDFGYVIHDTILNQVTVCRNITNSALFYGSDSLVYNYFINAGITIPSGGSNGNANIGIATSGSISISMDFFYCPPVALPFNIRSFFAEKSGAAKATLKWTGYDDAGSNYHYVAEWSRDGVHFSPITSLPKKNGSLNNSYEVGFNALDGEGLYYFRVKQVYANGYVRFSQTRQLHLGNTGSGKFSVFPNPSDGIVGIKFDTDTQGQYTIQIFNTQGQLMMMKEVTAASSSYLKIGTLKAGMYFVKATEKTTAESFVSQLLVK